MRSPLEKSPDAVCSVDRARVLGLDLKRVGTCAVKSKGVRGCSLWDSCRFHMKRNGGFKGTRPHNIGYFYRPLDGPPKVDICSCMTFIRSMQPQMDEGLALRMQGKRHQVVRIVAQEGEPVKVRQSPQKVDAKGNVTTQHIVKEIPVPTFPDPTELDGFMEYEREIMASFDEGDEFEESADAAPDGETDDRPDQLRE